MIRSSPDSSNWIHQRFESLHRRFLKSLVWPEAAGFALAEGEVGFRSTLEGYRWWFLGFGFFCSNKKVKKEEVGKEMDG